VSRPTVVLRQASRFGLSHHAADQGDPARDRNRKEVAGATALETKRDRNPPKKHGNIPLRAGDRGGTSNLADILEDTEEH